MSGLIRRRVTGVVINRGGATLLGTGLVDSVGTGLYLAGSAIYFTRVVGLSTTQVGLGLSLAGLLGFVALVPLGWVADQIGPRPLLITMNLLRAAGFIAYLFVGDFTEFLIVAAVLGMPEQAVSPIYQALVERIVGPEQRVRFMARSRATYNVGFTLGGLLATIALAIGTATALRAMFLGDAVTFVFTAALLPLVKMIAGSAPAKRARGMKLSAVRDRRYLALAGANGVLTLHMSLLSVAMPLWITLHTHAPAALVGMLLVVNTVLAVLLQVRATRGTDTVRGGARAMRAGGAALTLACLLFATAASLDRLWAIVVLFLAAVSLTAGELFQSAGGWGLSYQLAPLNARAEYLTTFNLGTSAQFVLGPTIVTLGVIQHGAVGWLGLAGIFVLTALIVGPIAAAAARHGPDVAAAPPPAPATTIDATPGPAALVTPSSAGSPGADD